MEMAYKSSFIEEAVARGFLYQSTNLAAMDEYLTTAGRCGYVGFDITARSLHVGGFIPIALMRLFQKHGHKPIILVGGGTTKIGDPSFRNAARPMLSDDEIAENMAGIKSCLLPFLKFGNGPSDAIMVDNADWLDNIQYIPFLRDIGRYFSINRMIGFDSVKSKLTENNSLSFLEFNYMVLQSYDFLELFSTKDCRIQFGGQDQWGNIVCGVELIKKKLGQEVFGFTNPLLTTNGGAKMGKTAQGAVWLRPDMFSAYNFWQFWRNVDDADVVRFIYLFTELGLEEIKKMEGVRGQELNDLKKILADQITTMVHGKESLTDIHNSVAGVFNGMIADSAYNRSDLSSMASLPKFCIEKSRMESGEVSVVDVLVESELCRSRGDAKKMLRGGGVQIDGAVTDEEYVFAKSVPDIGFWKLSLGKKKHLLIVLG